MYLSHAPHKKYFTVVTLHFPFWAFIMYVILQIFSQKAFFTILVSTLHTHKIAACLMSLKYKIRQFEASVKHMVAASAAVEHLLAHVGFLRFVFFFWWQQDGGRITTQHWEVLVAQIFVYVLVERKGYIVSVI